jgi:hypothetical protein
MVYGIGGKFGNGGHVLSVTYWYGGVADGSTPSSSTINSIL